MALVTDFQCKECNRTVLEVKINGICENCRISLEKRSRRVHFAGLKGLTLEERVEKIEKQLYDMNIERRLRLLESKLATY